MVKWRRSRGASQGGTTQPQRIQTVGAVSNSPSEQPKTQPASSSIEASTLKDYESASNGANKGHAPVSSGTPIVDRRAFVSWAGVGVVGFAGGLLSYFAQRFVDNRWFSTRHDLHVTIESPSTPAIDCIRLLFINFVDPDGKPASPLADTVLARTLEESPASSMTNESLNIPDDCGIDPFHSFIFTMINDGDFTETDITAEITVYARDFTSNPNDPGPRKPIYHGFIATTTPLMSSVIMKVKDHEIPTAYTWTMSLPRIHNGGRVDIVLLSEDPFLMSIMNGFSSETMFSEWLDNFPDTPR